MGEGEKKTSEREKRARTTDIFVWDDLDALDVAGGLKNLAKDVLRNPRIQPSHVQGAFVRLRGSAARDVARPAAGGRHNAGAHGRADGGRDGIVVLRDDDGRERRRHVVLLLLLLLGLRLLALVGAIVARRTGRCRRSRRRRVGHGLFDRSRQREKTRVVRSGRKRRRERIAEIRSLDA